MAWSITDWFPTWGSNGTKPASGFQYEGGDQVNEKHLDYLWYAVGQLEAEVRSALTDLDSDGDGIVDETDSVTAGGALNGNLVDSIGNVVYNDTGKYIEVARLQIKDGEAQEIDASEFGGSLGTAGQIIETDGLALNYVEPDGRYSPASHATSHKNGGSDELDAAELSGSLGTAGQVLQTDGSTASWGDSSSIEKIYGDGSDGVITRSTNGNENGIINCTSYTLDSSVTRTVSNGILIIRATDSIEINGTLEAVGGGAPGGSGGAGAVDSGNGSNGTNGTAGGFVGIFGAGGVGAPDSAGTSGSGGGGGGGGGDISRSGGDGGDCLNNSLSSTEEKSRPAFYTPVWDPVYNLTVLCGSGGGGGGGGSANGASTTLGGDGGDGGAGGGIIVLLAPTIQGSGTIRAVGEDGVNGGNASSTVNDPAGGGGGGGGGDGGFIGMFGTKDNFTGTVDVSGGTGGTGGSGLTSFGYDGGPGGNGDSGLIVRP